MTLSNSYRKTSLSPLVAALAAVALAAVAPSQASAHDTYIDRSDGSDGSAQCLKADPCSTIGRGLAKAGRGDKVFVGGDPGPFTTPVKLRGGKSLVQSDFSNDPAVDTSGLARIDTSSDLKPAITVASKAGAIRDLFINSGAASIEIHASVKVVHDKFLDATGMTGPVIDIAPDASGQATIKRNSIHGPAVPTGVQVAIRNDSGTHPLITGNSISKFTTAIETRGRPTILENRIWGIHAGGTSHGEGIVVHGGTAAITRNQLYDPDTSAAGGVTGIFLEGNAHLSGNQVFDYDTGIFLKNTPRAVDLTGDLIRTIAGGGSNGLAAVDDTDSPGVSDPIVSNMTIVGPAQAVTLDSVHMRMDSSIIGDTAGSFMSLSGGPTCKITNSRAPFAGVAADGCAFPTKKDPLFKADGYHLSSASPMIDEGNPAAPDRGARDIDGDRRALDGPDGGDCDGGGRRDIGADEYAC